MPNLPDLQDRGNLVCKVPQRGDTPGFAVYDWRHGFYMVNTENAEVKQISMCDKKWYEELSRKYYRGELRS